MTRSVTETFRLIYCYLVGVIGLRGSDVFLAAYPRSGSTWIRFMLCNLLSLEECDGKTVDFSVLNQTMVELGVNNLMNPWPYTAIPRVVKTHQRYWPVFRRAGGAIGVIRDPRDVMVSYFHFRKHRDRSYRGDFSEFIRGRGFGLEAWFRHYATWRTHWNLVISYEDMRANTYGEFRRVLGTLNVGCSEEVVREAIRRSSIEKVRSVEASYAGRQRKEARFARDGSTQQWRSYFSAADVAYYDRLVREYGIDVYGAASTE